MVCNHSKRSFLDDGSYQFAGKESCQVNCSKVASLLEIPLYQDIHDRTCIAGEESDEVFSHSQGKDKPVGDSISEWSVTAEPYPGSRCDDDPGCFCSLRLVTGSTHEHVVRSEHVKRPLTMEELHWHPYKRARQVDHCDWQVPFELPHLGAAHGESLTSVAACKDAFLGESFGDASGTTSSPSWVSYNTSEEECRPELQVQISSASYLAVNKVQPSGFAQADDICLPILDYYPRKHVAVGPDHQADIPAWSPQLVKKFTKELDSRVDFHLVTNEDDSEKFMGTCIIPMPDFTAVGQEDFIASVTNSGCSCYDKGSVRCVKQHVMEAREKLKETLGLGIFTELGFCDMGEYVMGKWTEEEEHTFLEVVCANPASLGKNFWNHLPHVFPSKSSKEIVSYYFNVFILKKRAQQNRLDPFNIDSDNDEWEQSDNESPFGDSESDSVVETPGDLDDAYNYDSHEEDDFHEDDEDGHACDDFLADEDHCQEFDGFSKGQARPILNYIPRIHHRGLDVHDVAEDHDIQDDSCTSYEGQQRAGVNSAGGPVTAYSCLGKDHNGDVGLSSVMDPSCIASLGGKAWDINYFSRQGETVDFLPTCHVIEEVFGKGSWDAESKDGPGVS